MTRRPLLTSVVAAIAVLVAFNLAVAMATRQTARRKFLARLEGAPPATGLLFLGNSLMEDGIDTDAFVAAWHPPGQAPVPYNAALHATTPVEHALVLEQAFSHLPRVRYIVYGYFDDQLSTQPDTGWQDMISSRALSYSFPDDSAALYAPGSMRTKWRFRAMSLIPMLADRTTLWSKVETLRKALGSLGTPAMASANQEMNELTKRLDSVSRDDRGFSPAVKEIFRLAEARGAQVIVVEMPSGHPPEFDDGPTARTLRAYNREKVEAANGIYLAASHWIQDRKYFGPDGVHLNREGARLFSARLGQDLSRRLEPSTTEADLDD
jgi:hypothetical protein